MTSTILALASLLLSGYIASAMERQLVADESPSLGNLLKTSMDRGHQFHSDNMAMGSRHRRSPRQDDIPITNPKYGPPTGQQHDNSQLARGPYYNSPIRGPYDEAGTFEDIPLKSARSFDSLGGGEIPWVGRRSKATAERDSRIQDRSFDTLGGGEIPWIGGRSLDKRGRQRK